MDGIEERKQVSGPSRPRFSLLMNRPEAKIKGFRCETPNTKNSEGTLLVCHHLPTPQQGRAGASTHACIAVALCLGNVLEANHLGVLAEALTADVETVLADDGLLVTAHAAVAGALAHGTGSDQLLTAAPLLEVTHVVRKSFLGEGGVGKKVIIRRKPCVVRNVAILEGKEKSKCRTRRKY
jgi:hypothetical protein